MGGDMNDATAATMRRRSQVLVAVLCLSCTAGSGAFSHAAFGMSRRAGTETTGRGARYPWVSYPKSSRLWMIQRNGRPRGPVRQIQEKPVMNTEIQHSTLRVVAAGPTGEKDEALGIMSKTEALSKAKDLGNLDLILINENADPPVCKIVDYSKYRYMKEKKAKEVKKNSKASELKEVKMSYNIDVHDYEVRKKNAQKFILQGNRVKCSVVFRGREVQHDKLGYELLQRLAGDLGKVCAMEKKPRRDGRAVSCILTPRTEVMKSISDGKRAAEKEKKKKKEEKKRQAVASKAASETDAGEESEETSGDKDGDDAEEVANEETEGDNDDDDDALSGGDLGSSLDELLGDDELTKDLFS